MLFEMAVIPTANADMMLSRVTRNRPSHGRQRCLSAVLTLHPSFAAEQNQGHARHEHAVVQDWVVAHCSRLLARAGVAVSHRQVYRQNQEQRHAMLLV